MVFSSTIFLFTFLPIVLSLYYIVRHRLRNYFLLAASLLFYAWGEPKNIVVMIASIVINYVAGMLLSAKRGRKITLAVAIGLNLGILIYFKYYNFIFININRLLSNDFVFRDIIMPIGISFFTFQGMSYVIDVYRNEVPVQKNPFYVALYISLFPQLIAGPIVRYKDVNEQISSRSVDFDGFIYGIRRFCIGLAKKMIIANQLGTVSDAIFATAMPQINAPIAWTGVICYAFQIYFDFSAYSDMAIGLGKMFGFTFLENFNYPYMSKSMTEFWRRWHISLSTWFRDYLYIPLGGNRHGNVYINLMIVFFSTGLWHGASWNFVAWGLFHGFFLIAERLLKRHGAHIPSIISRSYTFLVVLVGWVLFRSEGLSGALQYLGVMVGINPGMHVYLTLGWYLNRKILLLLAIAVLACVNWKEVCPQFFNSKHWLWLQNILCVVLLGISVILVLSGGFNPFIYFRF